MTLSVRWLGRVEYADGLELQRRFQEARRAGTAGDTLLLLEHNSVVTLGRGAKPGNILADAARLEELGVEVHPTDRGGDVTWHGPGQLVGYPLFHLPPGRQDVRKYVRNVEQVVISACAALGVAVHREPKWPGVWVKDSRLGGLRKVGAVGVHLSRWYTRHGFALNVDPDLKHFELIVPCGIREAGVTSLAAELGRPITLGEVEPLVAEAAARVFEQDLEVRGPDRQTISVVPWRRVSTGREVLLLKRSDPRGGFWQPVTGRVEAQEAVFAAAARELFEETGQRGASLRPLDYRHCFGFGPGEEVTVFEETAFAAELPADAAVTLDPREHVAFGWRPVAAALALVPYAGLREAIRRAAKA